MVEERFQRCLSGLIRAHYNESALLSGEWMRMM